MRGINSMTDDEFSSWFTHDGGPRPVPTGTTIIRECQKTKPWAKVVTLHPSIVLLEDNPYTFISLLTLQDLPPGPNSWEWKYFNMSNGKGQRIPKTTRYRVKKSPGIKLLESLVKDPPIDLIRDPERKLLEYHPS